MLVGVEFRKCRSRKIRSSLIYAETCHLGKCKFLLKHPNYTVIKVYPVSSFPDVFVSPKPS